MSDIAISVENVSKLYHLGLKASGSMRETISGKIDQIFQRHNEEPDETEFWALKNVTFEIKRGEAVGIIGKNGAGKSTLLKVLSRITEPTSGKIVINGKVSSLLEVGTGFHPELTGRENIYLNGSILGMKRHEIKQQFDEIVAFSGIEKFIDTPVKRYSSGMYVRLAFAVAAHLEPDILIIDEVLAVGDAEFQKKCLGKMQDVTGQGRTIIFVSHNMNAVNRLCQKAVFLTNGTVNSIGKTQDIIEDYLQVHSTGFVTQMLFNQENQSDKDIQLNQVELIYDNRRSIEGIIHTSDSFIIKYSITVNKFIKNPHLTFHLKNSQDEFVLFSDKNDDPNVIIPSDPGTYEIEIKINQPLLKPDRYFLFIGIVNLDNGQTNHFPSVLNFEIQELNNTRATRAGYLYLPLKWEIKKG